ncbi:MAG: adenosylcobinamide-GDP ribazoletransferase [Candidatus Omnitrophota bacterium]
MNLFFSALRFLTIIPLGKPDISEEETGRGTLFFPLVGGVIGLLSAAAYGLILYLGFGVDFAALAAVACLAIISGGAHLDGLADTFDAWASDKDRAGCLRIMRESRVGAMGVLALVIVVLSKVALVSGLSPQHIFVGLLVSGILSRWAQVVVVFAFSYARDNGKAGVFFRAANLRRFVLSSGIALGLALLSCGAMGTVLFVVAAAAAWGLAKMFSRRFGGVTGDNIGAVSEITELATLAGYTLLTQ